MGEQADRIIEDGEMEDIEEDPFWICPRCDGNGCLGSEWNITCTRCGGSGELQNNPEEE